MPKMPCRSRVSRDRAGIRIDGTVVCGGMTALSETGIGIGAWKESSRTRALCHTCLGNQTDAPAYAFVPQ